MYSQRKVGTKRKKEIYFVKERRTKEINQLFNLNWERQKNEQTDRSAQSAK